MAENDSNTATPVCIRLKSVRDFRKLLCSITKKLDDSDIEQIKYICELDNEKFSGNLAVFTMLEQRGLFSPINTDPLVVLLKDIERNDLAEHVITAYQQTTSCEDEVPSKPVTRTSSLPSQATTQYLSLRRCETVNGGNITRERSPALSVASSLSDLMEAFGSSTELHDGSEMSITFRRPRFATSDSVESLTRENKPSFESLKTTPHESQAMVQESTGGENSPSADQHRSSPMTLVKENSGWKHKLGQLKGGREEVGVSNLMEAFGSSTELHDGSEMSITFRRPWFTTSDSVETLTRENRPSFESLKTTPHESQAMMQESTGRENSPIADQHRSSPMTLAKENRGWKHRLGLKGGRDEVGVDKKPFHKQCWSIEKKFLTQDRINCDDRVPVDINCGSNNPYLTFLLFPHGLFGDLGKSMTLQLKLSLPDGCPPIPTKAIFELTWEVTTKEGESYRRLRQTKKPIQLSFKIGMEYIYKFLPYAALQKNDFDSLEITLCVSSSFTFGKT